MTAARISKQILWKLFSASNPHAKSTIRFQKLNVVNIGSIIIINYSEIIISFLYSNSKVFVLFNTTLSILMLFLWTFKNLRNLLEKVMRCSVI